MPKERTPARDPGLDAIANLEQLIIRAHDEKAMLGVPAEEVAAQRPAVVALAAAVAARLRDEYLGRSGR